MKKIHGIMAHTGPLLSRPMHLRVKCQRQALVSSKVECQNLVQIINRILKVTNIDALFSHQNQEDLMIRNSFVSCLHKSNTSLK
jgi:hypothetical protein